MALVLFVDDEPLTLKLLSQAADIIGHQAITADTGQGALETAAEKRPDLILLDLNLTDIDGLEVTKRLRGQPSTADIPIIILTAGTGHDDEKVSLEAGANAFLTKPIRLNTLIEVIRQHTAEE